MKITKIVLTFINFLLIAQISFAAVDACPGESRNLSYSSSNVPSGNCVTDATSPFIPPTAPAINASGTWTIAVPGTTPTGSYSFGLTCGGTPATGDTLNVLDKDSQACCAVSSGNTKAWNGSACVVPMCANGLAASFQPSCTCPTGQVQNGSACVTPTGSISTSPSPCTIAHNASNCASTITWTSQYASAANVLLDNVTNFSTGVANASQSFPYVAYGGNKFDLRDGTNLLASVIVSGVCAATTEWNASAVKCACPVGKVWNGTSCQLSPTGSISASPASCSILPDASSCATTLSWTTANLTGAKVSSPATATISTSLSGSLVVGVPSGSTTFTLTKTAPNPNASLASTAVLASCSGGSNWVASPAPGICECPVNTSADINHVCQPDKNAEIGAILDATYFNNLPNLRISVTAVCPNNSFAVKVIRSPLFSASVVNDWTNSTTDTISKYDEDGIVLKDIDQTYIYELNCIKKGNNNVVPGHTRTATVTIPSRVKISNVQNTLSRVTENVTARWSSTGNSCSVWDKQSIPAKIGDATRTGTANNYNYSFTLTPGATQWRTELNSTHLGPTALGYNIRCVDTVQIRGTDSKDFLSEVYKKPVANITESGSKLTFNCTTDYNEVSIDRNNSSLFSTTYTNAPTSNFSRTFEKVAGDYILKCGYKGNYSYAYYPTLDTNGQAIFRLGGSIKSLNGSIQSITNATTSTLTVSSPDGLLGSLSYNATGYDTLTVTKNGSPATGAYAPINGSANVSSDQDTTMYNNLTVKIVATKSGVTKTLDLILNKVTTPNAIINVVPTSDTTDNMDMMSVSGKCFNTAGGTYTITQNGTNVAGGTGTITENEFNITPVSVLATNVSTAKTTTFTLRCTPVSGLYKDATKVVPIPSRNPVNISALVVQPPQITCPGGNNEAVLKFALSNTSGKVCRITPTSINPARSSDMQFYTLDQELISSKYRGFSASNSSLADVMSDINHNSQSIGQINLKQASPYGVTKLFNYSTRFTMECGTPLPANPSRPDSTNTLTYSKKSVDMLSACTGQN